MVAIKRENDCRTGILTGAVGTALNSMLSNLPCSTRTMQEEIRAKRREGLRRKIKRLLLAVKTMFHYFRLET